MPPVVEAQWGKCTFLNLNDSVIVFGHFLLLMGSIHLSSGLINTVGRSSVV